MVLDLEANADTAQAASAQARALAASMGYTVQSARVYPQDPPDVSDAFVMARLLRRWRVRLEVVR